jgi:hypothetical protein
MAKLSIKSSSMRSEQDLTRVTEAESKSFVHREKKSSLLSTITWIVIALMLILIAGWTVWAARQPSIRSVWAPD